MVFGFRQQLDSPKPLTAKRYIRAELVELSTAARWNAVINSVTMITYTRKVLAFEVRDDTMTCGGRRDIWVDHSAFGVLDPLDPWLPQALSGILERVEGCITTPRMQEHSLMYTEHVHEYENTCTLSFQPMYCMRTYAVS